MAKIKNIAEVESKAYGDEPVWVDGVDFDAFYLRAMNYYNYMASYNHRRAFVLEYMTKNAFPQNDIDALALVPDKSFLTIGATARLASRGVPIPANILERETLQIRAILDAEHRKPKQFAKLEEETDTNSVSDHIRAKANELIGELEYEYDVFIDNLQIPGLRSHGFAIKKFKMYDWLREHQVKPVYVQFLQAWTEKEHNLPEIRKAISGDPQTVEQYEAFQPKHLKAIEGFFVAIQNDLKIWSLNNKQTRKPRKKKAKSAEKLVESMSYCKESGEFKLKSIPSTKIVGSEVLVAFNIKYKVAFFYVAADRGGLTVKGSKVKNFNPKLSFRKTIRKTDRDLPILQTATRAKIEKMLANLSTKPKPVNGSINEETVLIKVF